MAGLKYVQYDKLDKANRAKVEEEVLDMIENFKYMPLELGNPIPNK